MSVALSATLQNDIRKAFAHVGLRSVDDSMMSKCVALSTTIPVSPTQLATTWEAFSLNSNISELTELSFEAFRNVVLKEYDGAVISRPGLGKRHGLPMVTPESKRFNQDTTRLEADDSTTLDARTSRRVSFSPQKLVPHIQMPSYNERTAVGKVLVTYNPKMATALDYVPTKGKPRCSISLNFETNIAATYRHMFTPLEERARILDDQLTCIGGEIIEFLGGEGVAEIEAVGVPRQEKVTCIGRICNEAHEGRINQTSVLLEGTRHYSNGARIHLDVSSLKSSQIPYSLFPGQIVAVEGMNISGRKIIPNRVFCGAAPSVMKTKATELMHLHHDVQGGQPIKILSACGPYTTSENLEYAPLTDLIEIVRSQKPDVVILLGPFVHIGNSETTLEIEDGSQIQISYEVFFANKFSALLEELFENEPDLQTQFVLVPSIDDAVSDWVFPQAPLSDRLSDGGKIVNLPSAEGIETGTLGLQHIEVAGREGGGPRRVYCVSNPSTLQINEIVIGMTSNDIIYQISADETNSNLAPGSRLTRIAQHLLEQRSYYPLFPAAIGTCLDLRKLKFCEMPCKPDLLILPSKLTCFARPVLDSTMVVNPGHLVKGTTGGTYAIITIFPMERDKLEAAGGIDVEIEHLIPERVSVEIKRI